MKPDRSTTRLGWVGTGVMGGAMAANLLRAGWRLTVTTRTRTKAEPLLALGADWGDTPAEVARHSDIVMTMVGYPSDVEDVILGKNGIFAGFADAAPQNASKNAPQDEPQKTAFHRPIVIDFTTSSPSLARTLFEQGRGRGIDVLDAPVSGGDLGAKNGTLSIMAGGDRSVFDQVQPIFAVLGKTVQYHGEAGSGQHAKMANQILIAGNMAGVAEALLYVRKSGLDPDRFLASVASGAAGSWSLSNLAPRILKGDFAPGFYVEHFIKDMKIALDEAEKMGITLPILAEVRRLYEELARDGEGRNGTQAIVRILARRNGLSADWPNEPGKK